MHTLRSILCILLLSSTLTACTTNPLTQANKKMAVRHAATQAVLALFQNDTGTVFKHIHFAQNEADKKRSRIKKRAHTAHQYAQKMGGVASVRAGDVRYSDKHKRAKVQVTAKFKNGSTMTKAVYLRHIDNRWLVDR